MVVGRAGITVWFGVFGVAHATSSAASMTIRMRVFFMLRIIPGLGMAGALEKLPFIPRISASRQIQMQVETLARQRGLKLVGTDLVEEALAASAVK